MFGGNTVMRPHGSITQIFKFECAALVLLNFDENKTLSFLRLGEFVIRLIIKSTSSILMTTCRVRDFKWLIAKDAPIIRLGQRSFAFVMPGLVYGLQFAPFCSEDTIGTLERVLLRFSDYSDLLCEGRQAYPYRDNDLNFWTNIRPQIEEICRPKLSRFGHLFGRSPFPGGNSAVSNLLRAIRTCAATRIIADAMLTGFLKSIHISILDTRRLRERARRIHVIGSEEASASIEVVSNIVQALEMIWMQSTSPENSSQGHLATELQGELVSIPPRQLPFKHWKLNEAGMSIFVHNPTNPPGQQAGREAMFATEN
ncbi:uncharacterized protein LOC116208868 [Punica granatum]|uniref:Uncharacterized protein n=2 Tax=Punica granatum TaxID=22663 RepID=A0A218XBT4_PUNGR|nr:uncharacterized protein LOC116208868 [Punica granatum]OWM82248.1 hypothetical protein CDL15_Pgr001822 [Punica granatum]PKI76343.1 hypothetical protein CRG98_003265 [Punica granatum]